MVRSAVRVVLRTRPTSKFAEDCIKMNSDNRSIVLSMPKREGLGVVNHQQESYNFKFDSVQHNVGQEKMFETCGEEMVRNVLDGYNVTLLAYGQTGAGKTYTMTGGKYTQASYSQRGLVPRTISDLFNMIKAKTNTAVTVRISYAEIYNENIYDLLDPSTQPTDLVVHEDAKGGVQVKGLCYRPVASEEDALGLLFEGESNRAIGEHQLNKASSRSHTIFSLSLESRDGVEGQERVLLSKLHLVDLAGSERLSKTKSEGSVAKEAQYINKSLSFLEQVIIALGDKSRDHIPYRSSKLTHMLKDSLGGNCKTIMIANIWGESAQLEETLSTCKFAQRMTRVANDATVNFRQDAEMLVKKYEREIRELKQELAMHDSFSSRSGVSYDKYSEGQRVELRSMVKIFLEETVGIPDSVDPLEMTSLRHMKEILFQCRHLYQERPAPIGTEWALIGHDICECMDDQWLQVDLECHTLKRTRAMISPEAREEITGVGAAEDVAEKHAVGDAEGEELSMPCAPADARPEGDMQSYTPRSDASGLPHELPELSVPKTPAAQSVPPPSKTDAYENYKVGPGAELFNVGQTSMSTFLGVEPQMGADGEQIDSEGAEKEIQGTRE
eukprot:gene12243-14456_t